MILSKLVILIFWLFVIGVILWLVNRAPNIDPTIKNIIWAVIIIVAVALVLQVLFGVPVLGNLSI